MYQHVAGRFEMLKSTNRKIAHYTSAENAMNIISGKTIWLRNAALMNDFMEIRYGKQCLVAALQQRLSEIEALLNMNHNGIAAEVLNWITEVEYTVNSQTYITFLD